MTKILIIRFSALGDVAMTIPVIYSLAVAFPDLEITVLSRKHFESLFSNLPSNVRFVSADLNAKHKGILGLNALYTELARDKYDYVADFHSVLRSIYLRFRFKFAGVLTASIDKGRKEKGLLTQRENKLLTPLKSVFSRYQEVLERLGFTFELKFQSLLGSEKINPIEIVSYAGEKGNEKWLGIAPFAKHEGKIYPQELLIQVVSYFANHNQVKVFVFGGGAAEAAIINGWTEKYSSIVSMVGKLNMSQELQLMAQLDAMLTMDSGNMHLASLVNTPVVSVWGATHPYAGFMGWNQSLENAVQVDLACRPCSIYGQKPCFRGDYACLNDISPDIIIKRIEKLIF